jgi:hypothetical protein
VIHLRGDGTDQSSVLLPKAWEANVPPKAKLVLLAVASGLDPQPRHVSGMTGIPEREVRVLLDALEVEGFLHIGS